jgi:hypothetical protein
MSGVNASPTSTTGWGYGVGLHADVQCRVLCAGGAAVDGPARDQRESVGHDGGRVARDPLAVVMPRAYDRTEEADAALDRRGQAARGPRGS